MDVPAAGSEQIEDSKDTEEKRNTEEMTELEETERTAASEGAAEPEKVYSNGYSGGGETLALILGKKAGTVYCSAHVQLQMGWSI